MNICKNCGKEIYQSLSILCHRKIFCNRSCSATYNNSKRIRKKWAKVRPITPPIIKPLDTHSKVLRIVDAGEDRSCTICKSVFHVNKTYSLRATCSKQCYINLLSITRSKYLKDNHHLISGSGQQSYMERTFEQWIQNTLHISKGINGYLPEVEFYNEVTRRHGWCDFIFPRLRLVIELDGSHHIKRWDLDAIRDAYLKSRGWSVFRIPIKDYYKKTKIGIVKELLKPLTR